MIAWLRLPGGLIDPTTLDYVRAFDDPATRSIVVTAAFEGGSFAVIDSCTHRWSSTGELTLEFRRKLFRSRDGRTIRIGAFRIPYPPAGVALNDLRVQGPSSAITLPIEPMPAGFTTMTPVLDSIAD